MNKKLIIGVGLGVVVAIAGVFFLLGSQPAFDTSFIQADETELASWANDLEAYSQEETVITELDLTIGDILDEAASIGAEKALDETSIIQEASQADFSQTLSASATDDAVLQEIDQISGEVLQ